MTTTTINFKSLSESAKHAFIDVATAIGCDPELDRESGLFGIVNPNTLEIIGAGKTIEAALKSAL